MSKCQNCGSDLPENASFCPNCGSKVTAPSEPVQKEQTENQTWDFQGGTGSQNRSSDASQNPYQSTYQDSGQNSYQNPYQGSGQNPYQNTYQNPYQGSSQNTYQNNYQNSYQNTNWQQGPQTGQKVPVFGSFSVSETQLTIWSVISLLCCCLPLGVVSLIITLTAKNAQTQEDYEKKIRLAALLNAICIVIALISWSFNLMVMFLLD